MVRMRSLPLPFEAAQGSTPAVPAPLRVSRRVPAWLAAWRAFSPPATAATPPRHAAWRRHGAARASARSPAAMDELRLKIAVQKSGRLADPSVDLLVRCGLKLARGKDQLVGYGENLPLDVLFVRDDDIPDLVQQDVCDLGLVGLNVLEEKRLELAARGHPARFQRVRTLDFGRCRLALAIPQGSAWEGDRSLRGRRIATTYPFLLAHYLRERDIDA